MTQTGPARRRGRPRDPAVEDRVFAAALELYGRSGWAGFTFEGVTRATGIGKAALYRRWPNRAELLTAALRARWLRPADIDTGDLRADLLGLARMFLTLLTGPNGNVHLHLLMDTVQHEEVREATADYREGLARSGRAIVRRAVTRGELPAGTTPTLLTDLVVGGVTNHVVTTPPALRPAMEERMDGYAEQLVDAALRGLGAGRR